MDFDDKAWNIFYKTAKDVHDYLKHDDMIVVIAGSTEQHGDHLPLGTDSIQGWNIVAHACALAKVLYTPPIWTGYSPQHLMTIRPGTITVRSDTLRRLYHDIGRSLIHSGFNKIVFYLAHGSNQKVIDPILRELRYETGAFIAMFKPDMEYTLEMTKGIWVSPPEETPGWHSGEQETAQIMAFDEKLVKLENAKPTRGHSPTFLPPKFTKDSADPWATWDGKYKLLYVPLNHNEVTETGILGNPFVATKENGEKSVAIQSKIMADVLNELRKVNVVAVNREFSDRA